MCLIILTCECCLCCAAVLRPCKFWLAILVSKGNSIYNLGIRVCLSFYNHTCCICYSSLCGTCCIYSFRCNFGIYFLNMSLVVCTCECCVCYAVIIWPCKYRHSILMSDCWNFYSLCICISLSIKLYGCCISNLSGCLAGCVYSFRCNFSINFLNMSLIILTCKCYLCCAVVLRPCKYRCSILVSDCLDFSFLWVCINLSFKLDCCCVNCLSRFCTCCFYWLGCYHTFFYQYVCVIILTCECCFCCAVIIWPCEYRRSILMSDCLDFSFLWVCISLSFKLNCCCINCLSSFGACCVCSLRCYCSFYCLYMCLIILTCECCLCCAAVLRPCKFWLAILVSKGNSIYNLGIRVCLSFYNHTCCICYSSLCGTCCIYSFRCNFGIYFLNMSLVVCTCECCICCAVILRPSKYRLSILMSDCFDFSFLWVYICLSIKLYCCCISNLSRCLTDCGYCFWCNLGICCFYMNLIILTCKCCLGCAVIIWPCKYRCSILVSDCWNFYFLRVCISLSFKLNCCCINCLSSFGACCVCSLRCYCSFYCLYMCLIILTCKCCLGCAVTIWPCKYRCSIFMSDCRNCLMNSLKLCFAVIYGTIVNRIIRAVLCTVWFYSVLLYRSLRFDVILNCKLSSYKCHIIICIRTIFCCCSNIIVSGCLTFSSCNCDII